MQTLAWLLLILPLLSAAAIQLGVKRSPTASARLSVGSAVATFAIALVLLGAEGAHPWFKWATVGSFHLQIGLQLDDLAKGMMIVVTGVGALVHVFSLGYMKDDDAKARYFAGLSIFMFSMTGIVLADNFIMMFIFWELVGFSSYLLIGHWFRKDSAAEAAKKAFLVNRIGDFGFMLGILMLWVLLGHTFVFSEMKAAGLPAGSDTVAGIAVLLVFCGAVGKSAQFPLHVWLPDAMEGPTPVSALIHAATMVAAGVYMLFRLQVSLGAEVFAGFSGQTIAWVGGITSLLAALMATQQDDIKRILAYSTLSQLGYMIMAVGLAGYGAEHGGDAGMFHLFTHAWFKALLFLGAGAVIYACHHEQNIWKMGGLFERMPKTTITFAIGTAALMAVPFITAGFWSKEQILAEALRHSPPHFWLGAAVAVLTPFYMTRLFVIAFLGKPRDHGAKKAEEVGPVMLVPLAVLALLSVVAGFAFLAARFSPAYHPHDFHFDLVFFVSLGALLAGAGLGWALYKGRETDPLAANPVFKLFRHKFYLDELYLKLVRFFQDTVAAIVHFIDEFVINSLLVGGMARGAGGLGNLFRRLQTGNLQGYAILFGAGILLVVYLTVFAR